MATIQNIDQLRAEIGRLRSECSSKEMQLKSDLANVREDLRPTNILLSLLASVTGIHLNKNVFASGGILFGLSLLFQRVMLKTEKKAEDVVYHLIDALFEKIQGFVHKHTGHQSKADERRDAEK